ARDGGGTEAGTRRDEVVDDEHPLAGEARTGAEHGTVEARGAAPTSLGAVVALALEQPPARDAELRGDAPGDELGLVEPPPPAPRATGRRPRHHVDGVGAHTGRQQAVHEQTGDVV